MKTYVVTIKVAGKVVVQPGVEAASQAEAIEKVLVSKLGYSALATCTHFEEEA